MKGIGNSLHIYFKLPIAATCSLTIFIGKSWMFFVYMRVLLLVSTFTKGNEIKTCCSFLSKVTIKEKFSVFYSPTTSLGKVAAVEAQFFNAP